MLRAVAIGPGIWRVPEPPGPWGYVEGARRVARRLALMGFGLLVEISLGGHGEWLQARSK
jgi:hypothetical protein